MRFIDEYSGNDKNNAFLERFIPRNYQWTLLIKKHEEDLGNSYDIKKVISLQEREVFVRAKYEAFAFLLPITCNGTIFSGEMSPKWCSSTALPSRMIDFFCVIGSNGMVEKVEGKNPNQIQFESSILDCYPSRSFYADMPFPHHVSKFVFPEGCRPSFQMIQPKFFTFALTLDTGSRLYGAALQIYEENNSEEFISSFEHLELVTFFIPRCLTILSHYPLFHTFHSFLLQLHHITNFPTNPFPVERYVTNFTREVPLPPMGRVEVLAKFLPQLPSIRIRRPPPNELPMSGVYYQPLLSCLSFGNIMVVFGRLLTEI